MKRIVLTFLIFWAGIACSFSQTLQEKYPEEKPYYEAVDRWVMFSDLENDSTYHSGFVFLDGGEGFIFHMGHLFRITNNGVEMLERTDSLLGVKFRVGPEWRSFAIMPKEIINQLGLEETPDWLKAYKEDENEVSYMVGIGYHYNHAGASEYALVPLRKAYAASPHYNGLEFELAYAYNATKQYQDAILVLEPAIKNTPDNYLLYKEYGFALQNIDKLEEAGKVYKQGIKLCNSEYLKGEMALNMAQTYFFAGNKKEFKKWAKITRQYTEAGSQFDEYLKLCEKLLNNQ